MLDAQKLEELKDKNLISDEKLKTEKKRLFKRIFARERKSSPKNAIVYIILAFCFGAIGIHNLYAGYWKRGVLQFLLTLSAPYLMFVPLLFTSVWALIELLFVHRSADGEFMTGSHRWVMGLRIATILVIAWFASISDMVLNNVDLDVLQQMGDNIVQSVDMEELRELGKDIAEDF